MISIVIPTLNEAERLPSLLGALAAEASPHEIIVVDGGSRDGTVAVAERAGARVLAGAPGRGAQLAQGAREARGDVILFLHADTGFPAGGLAALLAELAQNPRAPGGNFHLLFDGTGPFDRWLEGFYRFIRLFGLYYGDSGIFVRRAVYERIGGMRPLPLMEDFDLVRRMERCGRTLRIETPPLMSSSRRFKGRAPWRIVSGWIVIHALYFVGVSPGRLARLYDSARMGRQSI